MTLYLRLLSIATFLSMALSNGYGQEGEYIEVRDLETWTSAQVGLKLNKKWSLGLEGQLRLDKNSQELKSIFSELGAAYKFSKHFSITGGFRYSIKNDNVGQVQGLEHFMRYQLDAEYKHDLKRFDLSYRFRYTNANEFGITQADGDIPEQFFRLKTGVDYNIRNWKLDPELAGEIFTKYVKDGQSNGFDSFRITAGTSYDLKSFGKIGLYYRMDREITSYYPKTTNIVMLKYAYKFKI